MGVIYGAFRFVFDCFQMRQFLINYGMVTKTFHYQRLDARKLVILIQGRITLALVPYFGFLFLRFRLELKHRTYRMHVKYIDLVLQRGSLLSECFYWLNKWPFMWIYCYSIGLYIILYVKSCNIWDEPIPRTSLRWRHDCSHGHYVKFVAVVICLCDTFKTFICGTFIRRRKKTKALVW